MYLVFIPAINANKILPQDLAMWLEIEGVADVIGKVVDLTGQG